jgi:hypothetical protein
VVFNRGAETSAAPELEQSAHDDFMLLKSGGHKGKMFEKSTLGIEDLDSASRQFIIRGDDALRYVDDWQVYTY